MNVSYFIKIPGFTNKMIEISIDTARPKNIFSTLIKIIPQKLKEKPLKKSDIPLPTFGFSRNGLTFGSS